MLFTSPDSTFRYEYERTAGCSPSAESKKQIGTCNAAGYGFLKDTILPLIGMDFAPGTRYADVEREFFTSLSHLSNLYQFEPLITDDIFPFNMYKAYQHAQQIVNQKSPNTQLAIMQDEHRLACLATKRTFHTGNMLYYISIDKVYQLATSNKKSLALCQALLSVFSYLFKIVKIPYYTGSVSMNCWYTTLKECTEMNEDDCTGQEHEENLQEFQELFDMGKKFKKLISQPLHLLHFEKRANRCKKSRSVPSSFKKIALDSFQLYRDYPHRSVHDNIHPEFSQNGDEDCSDPPPIYLDDYLSFYHRDEGNIYDQLIEYIDCDLQERVEILEPTVFQHFDCPQHRIQLDLDFEERLFGIITDLTYYLNNDL